jgi:chorismate mutase / prephenate dehydratase
MSKSPPEEVVSSLAGLRQQIDQIDEQVVTLLNKRAELVLGVRTAKARDGIDTYSPAREAQILDRVKRLAGGGPFPIAALERIFGAIISATRSLIGELNVSYVGPECTAGHEAAVKQFGEDVRFEPEASVEAVISRVLRGGSNYGVLPIETTETGLLVSTLSALADSGLQIVAEVDLHREFALIGQNSSLNELKRVYGEASSIAAAAHWLRTNLPHVELVLADSAAAASIPVRTDRSAAMVAAKTAAERFTLPVIASGIESSRDDISRFVVVGFRSPASTGRDKTSLLLTISDRPGILRDLLRPFAERGVTLLKIESKPRRGLGEFVFCVDVLLHHEDPTFAQIVNELTPLCLSVRNLGSYPAASATEPF